MLLKKNKKNKREIKLELENSFIVGEKCENKDLAKKADKVEKCKVATDVIKEYKEIIKIIRVVYRQGNLFKRFKEKEKFIKMVNKLGVSKSTMSHNKYREIGDQSSKVDELIFTT